LVLDRPQDGTCRLGAQRARGRKKRRKDRYPQKHRIRSSKYGIHECLLPQLGLESLLTHPETNVGPIVSCSASNTAPKAGLDRSRFIALYLPVVNVKTLVVE